MENRIICINRDRNAVLNMKKIATSYLNTKVFPLNFQRKTKIKEKDWDYEYYKTENMMNKKLRKIKRNDLKMRDLMETIKKELNLSNLLKRCQMDSSCKDVKVLYSAFISVSNNDS